MSALHERRRLRLAPPEPVETAADSRAIRVVIGDGNTLVRAGVRVLLDGQQPITVVGEAADGEQTVALARRVRPHVVLMDVNLPGLNSIEATRRLLMDPAIPVLLLTPSASDDRNHAALRSGASGVLLKDTEPGELVRAVEVVARGEALLSPSLTRLLIAAFSSQPEPGPPRRAPVGELTNREREVVALVALGLGNDEIAERLVVSPATARTHVSRAMVKLQARDRAQLVVFAYENGLVLPPAG